MRNLPHAITVSVDGQPCQLTKNTGNGWTFHVDGRTYDVADVTGDFGRQLRAKGRQMLGLALAGIELD